MRGFASGLVKRKRQITRTFVDETERENAIVVLGDLTDIRQRVQKKGKRDRRLVGAQNADTVSQLQFGVIYDDGQAQFIQSFPGAWS